LRNLKKKNILSLNFVNAIKKAYEAARAALYSNLTLVAEVNTIEETVLAGYLNEKDKIKEKHQNDNQQEHTPSLKQEDSPQTKS